MKILHLIPCADAANGVCRVAELLTKRQIAEGHEASVLTVGTFNGSAGLLRSPRTPDEVWVHGMWLPAEWRACLKVLSSTPAHDANSSRPRLVRMPHGSLSPIYLEQRGKWRKRAVAPLERWLFSKTEHVVVTGDWEAEWCRRWGLKNDLLVLDLKSFFDLNADPASEPCARALHVLYLGMRHPLKGVRFLERAVRAVNDEAGTREGGCRPVDLRIESHVFGEARERAWKWCDVLCLPTLSENFGLVVAEALERGKRVITTDGAPAWAPAPQPEAWRGRLTYLTGYRDGTDEMRVAMLKEALIRLCGGEILV